jgi:hypothetical protein
VYVTLQDTAYKRSALHYASSSGLESIVAKLLSLGADVALKDKVRACSYVNTLTWLCSSRLFAHTLSLSHTHEYVDMVVLV